MDTDRHLLPGPSNQGSPNDPGVKKTKNGKVLKEKAKSEGKKSYIPSYVNPNEKCLVCGDKSTGVHYRVMTCEGCKGFFRRTIQKAGKGVVPDLKCKKDGNCSMEQSSRNGCQACRYNKCIAVKMDPDSVLDENQRKTLKKKIKENRQNREKRNSQLLHPEEWEVLRGIGQRFKSPNPSSFYTFLTPKTVIRCFKETTPGILHAIEFIKAIPWIERLSRSDYLQLLRRHLLDFLGMRLAEAFDPNTNELCFNNFRLSESDVHSRFPRLKRIFNYAKEYSHYVSEDGILLGCLSVIRFLNADPFLELEDRAAVEKVQGSVQAIFWKYLAQEKPRSVLTIFTRLSDFENIRLYDQDILNKMTMKDRMPHHFLDLCLPFMPTPRNEDFFQEELITETEDLEKDSMPENFISVPQSDEDGRFIGEAVFSENAVIKEYFKELLENVTSTWDETNPDKFLNDIKVKLYSMKKEGALSNGNGFTTAHINGSHFIRNTLNRLCAFDQMGNGVSAARKYPTEGSSTVVTQAENERVVADWRLDSSAPADENDLKQVMPMPVRGSGASGPMPFERHSHVSAWLVNSSHINTPERETLEVLHPRNSIANEWVPSVPQVTVNPVPGNGGGVDELTLLKEEIYERLLCMTNKDGGVSTVEGNARLRRLLESVMDEKGISEFLARKGGKGKSLPIEQNPVPIDSLNVLFDPQVSQALDRMKTTVGRYSLPADSQVHKRPTSSGMYSSQNSSLSSIHSDHRARSETPSDYGSHTSLSTGHSPHHDSPIHPDRHSIYGPVVREFTSQVQDYQGVAVPYSHPINLSVHGKRDPGYAPHHEHYFDDSRSVSSTSTVSQTCHRVSDLSLGFSHAHSGRSPVGSFSSGSGASTQSFYYASPPPNSKQSVPSPPGVGQTRPHIFTSPEPKSSFSPPNARSSSNCSPDTSPPTSVSPVRNLKKRWLLDYTAGESSSKKSRPQN